MSISGAKKSACDIVMFSSSSRPSWLCNPRTATHFRWFTCHCLFRVSRGFLVWPQHQLLNHYYGYYNYSVPKYFLEQNRFEWNLTISSGQNAWLILLFLYKGSRVSRLTSRASIIGGNVLMIRKVKISDEGKYACSVGGVEIGSAELLVDCKWNWP